MREYAGLEPELWGSAPRNVKMKNPVFRWGFGCMSVFLLPFVIIGIGSIFMLAAALGLGFFGAKADARITNFQDSSGEDGYSYTKHYSYAVNNKYYTGNAFISASEYKRGEVGSHLQIVYLPWLPFVNSVTEQGHGPFNQAWMIALFSIFWNSIVSVFVFMSIIQPIRKQNLYRNGSIGIATITEKFTASSEDGKSYALNYEFSTHGTSETSSGKWSDKQPVDHQNWNSFEVGDKLTVLYNPKCIKQHVLYRFGRFEVIT